MTIHAIASNFQIDVPTSQKIKVGLKFGASNETTTSQSVQRVRTLGNDELGEVIINFADKFFIEKKSGILTGWRYETREYQSGWFSISVEPKKVQ